jgi:hypothetical protein
MVVKPFAYLSAALFIVIVVMGWFLNTYQKEIKDLTIDYATSEANRATCRASLAEQNAEIERIRLKKVDPKVVNRIEYKEGLKIVYKDRNITKEECNEMGSTIAAIRKRYN